MRPSLGKDSRKPRRPLDMSKTPAILNVHQDPGARALWVHQEIQHAHAFVLDEKWQIIAADAARCRMRGARLSYLLINADDFGLTAGVTEGILHCSASGLPFSTSVMPCVPGAEALVPRSMSRFRPGMGLHLQLTQGAPVLPAREVETLVDATGRFPIRRLGKAPDARQVAAEWRAQFSRLRSWGVEPDHLDSHHHVHGRPELGLLPVYAALAAETGLPARSGSRADAACLRQKGIACPDVVVWLSELDGDLDGLLAALEIERDIGPANLVVEVACHPGIADDELASVSRYVSQRERELGLLLNPETALAVKRCGWTILSYTDLQQVRPNP